LKNFVNSILEDKEPKPNGEDGIKALMICDAAIKSSKEGKPIRIVI
jgi:Predicted dehydrogenases and related proteins